ncbi:PAAR domain-containing protein [Pseudomonas sp. 5P_3.1_Bac2]|uniref:PAAR domain-containing protein n=1 Tax=Pseudomonas sp. 5P_3.1_Bac2 TaxID=2971617 RepID=UPI0021C7740B|nr:PAAR domain-containing protein [Pseudomonas sp. 5P_3.1_Bac2]MCU1718962.1 PAAR domain-containing protein [Pseudomonas sp. 5P_3.1_Bac2]
MSGKPAARLSDPTDCPKSGHGINPISAGSPNVLFDSLPAARQGDPSACGGAMASNVIGNVLINGKPAATVGTVGSHGNVVVSGSGTVIIGTAHTPAPFVPPVPVVFPGFDEQFRIIADSGEPIAGVPYHIRDGHGRVYKGFTDQSGKTPRIFTKDKQELEVSTGVHALEMWGQE